MLINRCYYPETRKAIDHYSYALNEEIGRGFSSKVYRGRDENNQMTVAVKVIDMKMVKQSIHATLLKNEINALKSFNSKNILKLFDVFQTQNNTYIITEFCDSGDLSGTIKKRGRIDEQEALRIMSDIITGLLEINQKGYIHRDIKPANILIEKQIPKIADFGFAVQINSLEVKQQGRHYNVGTPLYMSPQALRQQGHTEKGDVWAMGVMFFEMLFGQTPFTAQTEQGLLTAILHHPLIIPSYPQISDASKDFIRRCLCIDENMRMRIKDMATHAIYQQTICKPIPVLTQQQSLPQQTVTKTPTLNKDRSQSQGMREFNTRPKCQTQIHNDSKVSKRCPSEMYHLPHPPTNVVEPPISDPMRSKSQKQIVEQRKNTQQQESFEKRNNFKKSNTVLQERSINSIVQQPQQNSTPVQSPMKFKSNNDVLFAQINYCRFLYKFSQQLMSQRQLNLSNGLREKLLFLMAKNIAMKISKLHTISDKENAKENLFQLEDFQSYRKAESFQKFSQAIKEYNDNYQKHFEKVYQMIINKNLPQDKKFEALFDKDLCEFESFYFITQSYLRQALQELKNELPQNNQDSDAQILSEKSQFSYFVCQQLCNYLLLCHCTLQNMNDYRKFSKTLKIDQMVDQKMGRCSQKQVDELCIKMQELISK